MTRIDVTGHKFGQLTAIKFIPGNHKSGHKRISLKWLCKCECGNETLVELRRLQIGKTKSCGCRRKTSTSKTHGMSYTPEYKAWQSMIDRCYNKKNKNYYRYGGRGITVCDYWLNSFENFYKDMGNRPSNRHSLDRIGNNDNYYQKNCRWATKRQQANNMSKTVILEYMGESKPLSEWAICLGIRRTLLYDRLTSLKKTNQPLDRLFDLNNYKEKKYTFLGQSLTRAEWSERVRIEYNYFMRLSKIKPIEEVLPKYLKEEYQNLVF